MGQFICALRPSMDILVFRTLFVADAQDGIEREKNTLYRQPRVCGPDDRRSTAQFAAMVRCLACAIAIECRQAAVGGAVGMAHENDSVRPMQSNRELHLFHNEGAVKIGTRRRESQTAACNDHHVRIHDAAPVQEFTGSQPNSRVKAADHDCVCRIRLRTGMEIKEFSHLRSPISCECGSESSRISLRFIARLLEYLVGSRICLASLQRLRSQ